MIQKLKVISPYVECVTVLMLASSIIWLWQETPLPRNMFGLPVLGTIVASVCVIFLDPLRLPRGHRISQIMARTAFTLIAGFICFGVTIITHINATRLANWQEAIAEAGIVALLLACVCWTLTRFVPNLSPMARAET